MSRGVLRIQKRIQELETFDPNSVLQRWAPEVDAIQASIEEALAFAFGQDTVKYKRYSSAASLDNGQVIAGRQPSIQVVRGYLAEGKQAAIILLRQAVRSLEEEIQEEKSLALRVAPNEQNAGREHEDRQVFVGHGRSLVWLQLKAFLSERLRLKCDEFNAEAVAGITTTSRLQQLLDRAGFAFLVMTAEDTHADNSRHARENVIHEAGLFQGRLGFERAIILLEEGCAQFSNIHGLSYIGFPKGNMEPAFEKIRQVLEREHVT
jgi:predicted nucleotide-binding protein